jgi:hypothetical protein
MNTSESANDAQPDEIDDRRLTPDRRVSSRRKILKGGRTFWPNGDSSECIVCNLSETGAQLDVRGQAPNIFDLVVEGDPWRRSCVVIWRKANRIGVKFQAPSCLEATSEKKSAAHFLRYVDKCRTLAQQADPSHREILLEMADAWAIVVRRLRSNAR